MEIPGGTRPFFFVFFLGVPGRSRDGGQQPATTYNPPPHVGNPRARQGRYRSVGCLPSLLHFTNCDTLSTFKPSTHRCCLSTFPEAFPYSSTCTCEFSTVRHPSEHGSLYHGNSCRPRSANRIGFIHLARPSGRELPGQREAPCVFRMTSWVDIAQ